MTGNDVGSLIYLIILGLMVISWFVAQNRYSMNKTLQAAAVWALIFVGAVAAYGLWDDISNTVMPRQTSYSDTGQTVVPRHPDGHYYLRAEVNDVPVDFVLDTGATDMVLTRRDAEAIGLDPDNLIYTGRAMTANGMVETAAVRLDSVTLGSVTDRNLPAVVNSGEMSQSLLGMNYLQRWGSIEISGGELTLTR
ncbi:TIGR02281 family clan AA aspartic protease [uncultured Roseobacter sp.]|uniref:retropepsin-like aspartic protease family protein n=1 Tax=uncultured Roseobacter sp. TaxID=114847 RepID=UPI00261B9BF2|nr:TIGR02281 family clan AA aspartic protease [uncultured Roseobacter sp.]